MKTPRATDHDGGDSSITSSDSPGKRTRTAAIQRRASAPAPSAGTGGPAASGALPGQLQAQMDAAFDFDFSAVRVHEGPQAAALGAEAFTTGTDVHFAPGRYDPGSASGQSLIGHELAHVVQQSEGRVAATTQFKGVAGNDDAGLEAEADRWGEQAARGAPVGRSGGVTAPGPAAAVQRKLTITGHNACELDGEPGLQQFRELVGVLDPRLLTPQFENAWRIGRLQRYVKQIHEGEHTAPWDSIAEAAHGSASVAIAVGGEGLPLFDNPEGVTFGDSEGSGAKGYIGKMVKGLEELLPSIKHVKVSVAQLEGMGMSELSGCVPISAPSSSEVSSSVASSSMPERRPGLTILNYAKVFLDKATGTLLVTEARGHSLCDQFALALRGYAKHRGLEFAVERVDAPETELLTGNYGRLAQFFEDADRFRQAQTLSFGYANAFPKDERFVPVATKSKAGWVGTLYQVGEGRFVAILDSDVRSSYHGEILAKNVKLLLESGHLTQLTTILAGGSAGSLIPDVPNEREPHLTPATIYTPQFIQGPDGKLVPNALAGLGQSNIEGSIHTSVVSALVETPQVLDMLVEGGIQTIDMEFGYVAAVITKHNEGKEQGVKFGIACLITDYPRTSGGTDLHSKDSEQKDKAKRVFTDTVHKAAQ